MNATTLWLLAVAMGVYQGVNPPTSWLRAVGRGLETGSHRAALAGTFALALGHCLAMAVLLLPMALVIALLTMGDFVRMDQLMRAGWIVSGTLILFGLYKILRPQHPRFIARIRPQQPVRWAFWMGVTHCGSPLMMVPMLINLLMLQSGFKICGTSALAPALDAMLLALAICLAMALPLFLTGSAVSVAIMRRLGWRAVTRYWVNLDLGWAASFVVMGVMGFGMR
jgi:hypothetical protein